jgi:hypothetical protein
MVVNLKKEQKVVIRFLGYWNNALNWLAKKKTGQAVDM